MEPRYIRKPTTFSPDPPAVCRGVAAARLYLDRRTVTTSATCLRRAYARAYGPWPFEEPPDAEGFYRREYLKLWEAADIVRELLAGIPTGLLADWA
jgi:hypothetical protein